MGGEAGGGYVVVRLNPDGTPDATLGTGGVALAGSPGPLIAKEVAVQPDGGILVAGQRGDGQHLPSSPALVLTRFAADGSVDTGFGTDGSVVNPVALASAGLALQPDGKILAAGISPQNNLDVLVARHQADGTPDATFATGGTFLADFGLPDCPGHCSAGLTGLEPATPPSLYLPARRGAGGIRASSSSRRGTRVTARATEGIRRDGTRCRSSDCLLNCSRGGPHMS